MSNRISAPKQQAGVALAISLVFLLVLTLVAVTGMNNSNLGFKISANTIAHEEAFNASETGRRSMVSGVESYLQNGSSWQGLSLPNGMSEQSATDWTTQKLSTYPYQAKGGTHTANYSNGDVAAEIHAFKLNTNVNSGSSVLQYKGYGGVGNAAARGGVVVNYELRSRGTGKSEAWTAADYRYIPK